MTHRTSPKIGVISIGLPYFDFPLAQQHLDATRAALGGRFSLAGPQAVVTDTVALDAAIAELRRADIAALLLQLGTFPDGEAPARLAERLRVPVVVHALPEPAIEHRIALNSLCGANLTTFTLTALGHPHTSIYGTPADPACLRSLTAHLTAATALADLRDERLGLIGYRAPGFYPCVFDELLLRRQLGIAIDHIGLNEMTAALQNAAPKTAPTTAFPIIEGGFLSRDAVAAMERYYGALTSLLAHTGHRVIAIKDWPELFDLDSPGGFWPALGWVQDDGIVVAPEGDVNGAVTMALAHNLTGRTPFFADISAVDDANSALLLWHYGGAPSLVRNPAELRYGSEGREVEFTLKPGPATLLRVGLHAGSLRILAVAVTVEDRPVTIRRAAAWIRTVRTPAGAVLRTILDEGWEHHSSLVHGDITEELRAVARFTGIPLVAL